MAFSRQLTLWCLFTFGALALPGPSVADETKSDRGLDHGAALSAETLVRDLIENTYALRNAPGSPRRRVTYYLASTPAGHQKLREIVSEKDPHRATFAISFLSESPSLDDIPLVLAAVERHADNNKIVVEATSYLDRICINFPVVERLGLGESEPGDAEIGARCA